MNQTHGRSNIKSGFRIALLLAVMLLMANLSALVDTVLHPEIPFFDVEHLIVGGVTSLTCAILLLLLDYFYRRSIKRTQELELVRIQNIEQERLRVMGQLASGITHDFNNAITPVLGYSELLLDNPEDLDDHEKVISYLKIINQSAQDAANVARQLREFYQKRGNDRTFSRVKLDTILREVSSITQPRWKNQKQSDGCLIEIRYGLEEVAPVAGDPSELRELFTNLVLNAVDALPKGGVITLRTHNENDQVVAEISDLGIGMTAEVLNRCKEHFFSTKGADGTGLGLSMANAIVLRHNGVLSVESNPGQGSTISVTFPAFHGTQELLATTTLENYVRPLHILVVDDEEQIRNMLSTYLTGDGHTVEIAADGNEALSKFIDGQFDLVLTDLSMPAMNGYQLATAINNILPRKPVIMLTGFGYLMESAEEIPQGVDLLLTKPVTLDALRKALANVVTQNPG